MLREKKPMDNLKIITEAQEEENKTKQNKTLAKKIKDPLCLFVGRDPVVHLQQTEKMVDCEINTLEIEIITFFLEMTGNIHLLLAGLEKVL